MPGSHPPPVTVLNEQGRSPYVLVCEHATNWLPPEYSGLGLPASDLARHIAWDIGALHVAHRLSKQLDAALIAAGASRLLIDLNRPTNSATSIPEISEATVIPGNLNMSATERQRRITTWFDPFQSRIARLLDDRQTAQLPTIIVAVHSFTPVFHGKPREMEAGVLYRRSWQFGSDLVDALGGAACAIAHNEPYHIEDESDYTVPVHGEARGLDAVLIEIRQDLISNPEGAATWADRLATALLTAVPTFNKR